jgi:hypothetical protein
MNKNNRFTTTIMLLAVFVPGIFFSSVANSVSVTMPDNMHVGFDLGLKHTGVKSSAGHGLFRSTHKMGRYILATQITPTIGAELYIERSIGEGRRPSIRGASNVRFSNAGLAVTYKYNIPNCDNIKPFVSLGLKNVKVKLEHNKIVDLYLTKSKILWKVNGGLEFMFNDHVGTRMLTTFENSSRIKPSGNGHTARLGNSFGVSAMLIAKVL